MKAPIGRGGPVSSIKQRSRALTWNASDGKFLRHSPDDRKDHMRGRQAVDDGE